jgi:hypothetical protein
MKNKSKKYHVGATEKERERALVYKLIDENRQWRDRYVGTLMMLAYDGCISDSRAREIIGMDIYQWRANWRKVCKTWADGHRECQDLYREYRSGKRGKRAAMPPNPTPSPATRQEERHEQ